MELNEFMLIFIGVDYTEMDLSPEEIQVRAKSWMDWQQKMTEQGILQSGNALQSPCVYSLTPTNLLIIYFPETSTLW